MLEDTYDFIIVGGGTAGLVLANRLSEDESVQILILEAGEDLSADPRVITPALWVTMLGTDVDWNFKTEKQDGLSSRSIKIPHGRVLGGSSAINGQAFVPTSKLNIDTWGELGNTGWDWETLAPYFRKCHTLYAPTDPAVRDHLHVDYIDSAISGHDGPIQVSFSNDTTNPLGRCWVEALNILGHRATGDPFSGSMIGAFTNAATTDPTTHCRSYSVSAYLDPARGRPNLTIVTGAQAQKLLLDSTYPSVAVTGVQFLKDGQIMTINTKQEIILAAGAFHSPKILELSGIGNRKLLDEFDIKTIIDNPYVGENLQDHPMAGLSFEVREGIETLDALFRQEPQAMHAAMEQYAKDTSGPLAVGDAYSYALLPLPVGSRSHLREHLVSHASPSDSHPMASFQRPYVGKLLLDPTEASASFFAWPAQGNFDSGTQDSNSAMTSKFLPGNFYTINVNLLQPLSRGSSHIQSSDPRVTVKIDGGYLTHPLDLEAMAHHMTYISRIINTEPFNTLLRPGGQRNTSAPADLTDVDSMKEYLKRTATSSWHPTSTCAMLPQDKGGVVNERLIVHGTKNLRIVDASVMPITSRGNPMATVYAVAERAADIVKEDLKMMKE